MKLFLFQWFICPASFGFGASKVCDLLTGRQNTWARTGYAIAFSLFLLSGCANPTLPAEPRLAVVHSSPPPSTTESYCAWYGEVGGDVFYIGEAAFWSAMHAANDEPTADLYEPGPQPIGRFDLGLHAECACYHDCGQAENLDQWIYDWCSHNAKDF